MFDEWVQVLASDVVKLSQKVSEEFRTGNGLDTSSGRPCLKTRASNDTVYAGSKIRTTVYC